MQQQKTKPLNSKLQVVETAHDSRNEDMYSYTKSMYVANTDMSLPNGIGDPQPDTCNFHTHASGFI